MLIPPDWNFIIPLYQSVHTSSSSKKLAVWMKPIEKLGNNSCVLMSTLYKEAKESFGLLVCAM